MPSNTDTADKLNASTMTRGERIRSAARTLRTPRTASWIAEETEVTTKTAQKYLDQLVEDNVLRKIEQGNQSLYCVDQLMATYREVASLQREHNREELTNTLESMQTTIANWKAEYDVDTPGELRASIADLEDTDEITTRREIASEGEHLADRTPIVKAALNEYDWATKRDAIPM